MKTEYTISQIAEKLHITTNKIRFYEKKGLLTPMRESQNRYRKFGEEDIFRLETILLYRSLGLSIEAIQNILQCNKKENYLTHMQNQWMAVNNEIHRLSEIRKSLEMVLDKVYEETEGQDLEKDFLKIIEQSNLLCQVKNEWKDQWDFDGWARAYDEDVKRDTGALKIYENYETVLQTVFEEVEKLQRKESRVWEMIKVAICDDDIATTGKIEDMLCRIAKRNFIPIETEVFWEGEHLSEAVESMDNFDVIFLDIEMGQADGITVARKIRETDKNVLIIYVTSHESYMQESFSVRPFRFLVKPVEEKQIAGCLEAAYEEISSADSYFRYSYQRLNCKIPVRDILYFESKRRKVYIVTEKETFEFYGKLNEIEESLRASKGIFLRIHQSFLINYKHIKGLAYDFAVMDNEERLSISEDRRKLISEQYCAMEDTFYVGM